MKILIVEEKDENAIECDEIKLLAFRPKMRVLCFEEDHKFEEAKKQLKDKQIEFELP